MNVELILFLGLALIAVISAVSMLISKNAVHSALFLVLNFMVIALIYLLLNAAFVAMVQITVYAGAIMVLFLFIIMLLGAEEADKGRSLPWQIPVAITLGLGILAELVYIFFAHRPAMDSAMQALDSTFGSPAAIGRLLFNEYMLPFEATSVLLLIAMVGAIVLSRDEKEAK